MTRFDYPAYVAEVTAMVRKNDRPPALFGRPPLMAVGVVLGLWVVAIGQVVRWFS